MFESDFFCRTHIKSFTIVIIDVLSISFLFSSIAFCGRIITGEIKLSEYTELKSHVSLIFISFPIWYPGILAPSANSPTIRTFNGISDKEFVSSKSEVNSTTSPIFNSLASFEITAGISEIWLDLFNQFPCSNCGIYDAINFSSYAHIWKSNCLLYCFALARTIDEHVISVPGRIASNCSLLFIAILFSSTIPFVNTTNPFPVANELTAFTSANLLSKMQILDIIIKFIIIIWTKIIMYNIFWLFKFLHAKYKYAFFITLLLLKNIER